MKITKLFEGLLIPFLIFILVGNSCPEPEPKKCDAFETKKYQLYKLNENSSKKIQFKSNFAAAKCKARFFVAFGWKNADKFSSKSERSPIDNTFGGLKLSFGETAYSKTFSSTIPIQRTGKSPYTGSSGYVWVIDVPVSAITTNDGGTYFYVNIEHDILEEDFDFYVDVTIEYSDDF